LEEVFPHAEPDEEFWLQDCEGHSVLLLKPFSLILESISEQPDKAGSMNASNSSNTINSTAPPSPPPVTAVNDVEQLAFYSVFLVALVGMCVYQFWQDWRTRPSTTLPTLFSDS
jgi:hypothetical protein